MDCAPSPTGTPSTDARTSEQALSQLAEDFPRASPRILALIFYSYTVRLGSVEAALHAARARLADACAVAA
jgi:hypothetical protein